MTNRLLIGFILSCALAACCDSSSADTTLVTREQNGSTLTLPVGDTLAIELAGNPTTGYEWVVAQADAHLLEAAETEYQSDSDALGAGGRYTFRFRALASGSTPVVLAYRRSWEPDPIETFSLTVTIP